MGGRLCDVPGSGPRGNSSCTALRGSGRLRVLRIGCRDHEGVNGALEVELFDAGEGHVDEVLTKTGKFAVGMAGQRFYHQRFGA